MLYYIYDHTYEGLLTAVFDAFFRKEEPTRILGQREEVPLFTESHHVDTDKEKADRVLAGLKKKISDSALNMLFVSFLSEQKDIELMIFRYIKKAFSSDVSIELNFGDDDVLSLSKLFRSVKNESTRIKEFVRFQRVSDRLYIALIDPKYDVLPLCYSFFEDRYADQPWIIYDKARHYGVHYDLNKTEIVHFEQLNLHWDTGKLHDELLDEDEKTFQTLWKDYLSAITIQQRKNLRLQRQMMPKRFWEYLTEKQ